MNIKDELTKPLYKYSFDGDSFHTYILFEDMDTILEEQTKIVKEYVTEVLKLAAEKAKITAKKKSVYGKHRKWQNVKDGEEVDLFAYEMQYFVDKNSILNLIEEL